MKNSFLFLALALLSISIGCSGFPQKMKYVSNLKHVLTETHGLHEVEVNLQNNSELLIIIKDEEFTGLSSLEKKQFSLEIGRLVADFNGESVALTKGEVQFRFEKDLGITKVSGSDTYAMFP